MKRIGLLFGFLSVVFFLLPLAAQDAKKDDKDNKDKELVTRKPVTVKVDLDGIHDRLIALDIPSANYTNPRLVSDRIF